MDFVLDTSALLTGKPFPGKLWTTAGVVSELQGLGEERLLDPILDIVLFVAQPQHTILEEIDCVARASGDARTLSDTDRELLALAKEKGARLVTDDYAMQNVAVSLGIAYTGIDQKEITEKVVWGFRCKGCGRSFEEPPADCPVCGSPVIRKRKVRTRVASDASGRT